MKQGSLLAGVGVGAGVIYFLDPDRGARRRARVRDTVAHTAGITRRAAGTTYRDAHRADVLQYHWSPTTRAIVGAVGVALATAGAFRRDSRGTSAMLLGAALVARAATNLPIHRLTGIAPARRAVDIQKTITINAAVGEVYAFWSQYENFPRFMSRVVEVTSSANQPRRSHWKVTGPAGAPVAFDAEITRTVPNQMIAWRTVAGSAVGHAGVVRFDPDADGRTRVHIRMSYNPPAGWLGHGIATAFGVDPKSSLDADLLRMKTLIETGHAPHDASRRETTPVLSPNYRT